jgi:MinD-like ATPase involved in chromosome partitioning or flagellar assembly
MEVNSPPGQIITFYSYKGGTGRSMALANVAWILASNRKKVFVIDWDLEAPGLHRYFRPFLIDKELATSDGLIDVVQSYVEHTIDRLTEGNSEFQDEEAVRQWAESFADIGAHAISLQFPFPGGGYIDFLPAGRQVAAYPERVNTFNWHEFYQRFGGGAFLEAVKQRLRAEYDYILIDSRTGVSDTSGISTVQMPDILAVCFTYNNQSIAGAAAIAQSVRDARGKLSDTAPGAFPGNAGQAVPFRIFPIPTRVEQSERAKLLVRQNYARHRFASLIDHLEDHVRERYWSEVEVPYIPFHAYEESLAALTDDPNDEKLILKAMRRLTSQLTGGAITEYQKGVGGEELSAILKEFAETHQSAAAAEPVAKAEIEGQPDIIAQADLLMAQLNASELPVAQKLWKRLVSARDTASSAGLVLSSWPIDQLSLPDDEKRLADRFISAGLIRRHIDSSRLELIEIANDALVRRWEPLQTWVKEDHVFLEWRVQLTQARQRWENNAFEPSYLLTGSALENAPVWIKHRSGDLLEADIAFLDRSKAHAERKNIKLFLSVVGGGLAVVASLVSYAVFQKQSAERAQAELERSNAALSAARATVELPVYQNDAQKAVDYAASNTKPVDYQTAPPVKLRAAAKPAGADGVRPAPAARTPAAQAEAERRAKIVVTYFAKASDPPSAAPELTKFGYQITLGSSPLMLATNTIWFGCQQPLNSDDARAIASLLIREGVALRKLDTFTGQRRQQPLVHVGADQANVRISPLTDADVNAFDLAAACRGAVTARVTASAGNRAKD